MSLYIAAYMLLFYCIVLFFNGAQAAYFTNICSVSHNKIFQNSG